MAVNSLADIGDILALAYTELQEDTFFGSASTSDLMKDLFNQAYVKLCKILKVGRTTDTTITSTAGTQEYDWPSDAIVVTNITCDDGALIKEDFRVTLRRMSGLSTTALRGLTNRYYLRGRKIGLWKIPQESDLTIKVWYLKYPALLDDSTITTSSTPVIPLESRLALVYYMCYRGYCVMGEDNQAIKYYKKFKDEILDDLTIENEAEPDYIICTPEYD